MIIFYWITLIVYNRFMASPVQRGEIIACAGPCARLAVAAAGHNCSEEKVGLATHDESVHILR